MNAVDKNCAAGDSPREPFHIAVAIYVIMFLHIKIFTAINLDGKI